MAEERIKIIVEPDVSGFERELETDLKKVDVNFNVDVKADTDPLTAEMKAAKAKAEANPIEIPVTLDTKAAVVQEAKIRATFAAPIVKAVTANVAPALASIRRVTTLAAAPVVKTLFLATGPAMAAIGKLRGALLSTFALLTSKTAALGAAFVGAFAAVKSVQTVQELGKSQKFLSDQFGLSTKAAGEFAAIAKVLDIDSKKLSMGLTVLSRNAVAAAAGGEKQSKAFAALGVSQKLLKTGDTTKILAATAEGLKNMEGGTRKAAITQQLLGRGAIGLRPLLKGGAQGIDELRESVNKYGAVLSDPEAVSKFTAAQKQLKFALLGAQVQLGQRLIPTLAKGISSFTEWIATSKPLHRILQGIGAVIGGVTRGVQGFAKSFAASFSKGKTKNAQSFSQTMKNLGEQVGEIAEKWIPKLGAALGTVAGFLTEHETLLKGLVAVFIAYKLNLGLITAATLAWNAVLITIRVATLLWTAAQWLLNAALIANPIGLIVVGIAALVAGLIIAYQKSETFRNIVNSAFAMIKKTVLGVINWFRKAIPAAFNFVLAFLRKWGLTILAVMTGPIGLLVLLIYRNWDKIRTITAAAWERIKSAVVTKFNQVVAFIRGAKDRIVSIFSGAGSWLYDTGERIINGLWRGMKAVWNNIADWLGGLKDKIISLKGPPETDSNLLVDNGMRVMNGFWEGMKTKWNPIEGWLGGVGGWLKELVSGEDASADIAQVLAGNKKWGEVMNNLDPSGGLLTGVPGGAGGVIAPAADKYDVYAQGQLLAKAFSLAISSWQRSVVGNTAVGGATNSQHVSGFAVDFAGIWQNMDKLAKFARLLVGKAFTQVLWQVADHFDHVHIGWLHKRAGGRVQKGQPLIVGETGQEGFVPDSSGMILSNAKLQRLLSMGRRVDKIEGMLSGGRAGAVAVGQSRPMIQQTNDITLVHPNNDPSSIMAALNARLDMFARTATAGLAP